MPTLKTHEALNRAIGGQTAAHAFELHLATITVNKWQEPTGDWSDSGAFNPLDRLEKIIETALKLGRVSPDDACAPIEYLAQRFGRILLPLPPQSIEPSELQKALLATIKEFGELAAASSKALEDGRLSRIECTCIIDEAYQVLATVGTYTKFIEGIRTRA